MPGLPKGLWLSTICIAFVSWCFSRAIRAVKVNHLESLERWLWLVFLGAVAFLVAQALNWRVMITGMALVERRTLYAFTFYMLTGLHAAHVVGGFFPTLVRAAKSTPSDNIRAHVTKGFASVGATGTTSGSSGLSF